MEGEAEGEADEVEEGRGVERGGEEELAAAQEGFPVGGEAVGERVCGDEGLEDLVAVKSPGPAEMYRYEEEGGEEGGRKMGGR
jgi:hypothetical protein